MFSLGRHCIKFVKRSGYQLTNLREKATTLGSEDCHENNKKDISSTKELCLPNGDDPSEKRGNIKVGLIGGGMTPIYTAILLKQSRLIKKVNVADPKDTLEGAVCDANHIDTSTQIQYYGKEYIKDALADMDIVALMDETDFDIGREGPVTQFIVTSSYVHEMSKYMVQSCPSALVAVFARPVTATMPMVSEVYKCADRWDSRRIVGSTAIDAMRIEAMTASLFNLNPAYLSVPIVGGADPCTVVPLLNRTKPVHQFSPDLENQLIHQLRAADNELALSVDRFKGPSLSSGVAAAKFIVALALGLSGCPNVISSAYVRSNVLPVCRFFTNEVQFGPHGVEKNLGLPRVSPRAISLIETAIPHINELSDMATNVVCNKNGAAIKPESTPTFNRATLGSTIAIGCQPIST